MRRLLCPAKCLGQSCEQISRNQRMLTHALARHISRQTVQMNRRDHRFGDATRILRDQASHHAGQYVARASGRHARISGCVHPNRSVRLRDQSSMALQYDNQFDVRGQSCGPRSTGRAARRRLVNPVSRAISPGCGVITRSPALSFSSAARSFEGVEAIGVQHNLHLVFPDHASHKGRSLGMTRNARPTASTVFPFTSSVHPPCSSETEEMLPASVSSSGSVMSSG